MEKVRYMISDASSMVNVESHVLRYWEDELELNIPRNEMGHRYYTQENIKEFQYIKELKEKGYQLKAIKMIVHNGDMEQRLPELTGNEADKPDGVKNHQVYFKNPETLALAEAKQSILDNTDRMAQFTELMTDIVGKAIAANNESLSRTISEDNTLNVHISNLRNKLKAVCPDKDFIDTVWGIGYRLHKARD